MSMSHNADFYTWALEQAARSCAQASSMRPTCLRSPRSLKAWAVPKPLSEPGFR